MPSAPEEDGGRPAHGYVAETLDEHSVAMWANIPITQVGELPLLDYLRFRRDHFITRLGQTEKGEDYLVRAWRLSRTEPDREAARAAFG